MLVRKPIFAGCIKTARFVTTPKEKKLHTRPLSVHTTHWFFSTAALPPLSSAALQGSPKASPALSISALFTPETYFSTCCSKPPHSSASSHFSPTYNALPNNGRDPAAVVARVAWLPVWLPAFAISKTAPTPAPVPAPAPSNQPLLTKLLVRETLQRTPRRCSAVPTTTRHQPRPVCPLIGNRR